MGSTVEARMSNVGGASPTVRQSLRIMLVDDHATVRQGLRALFQSIPNAHIVHEAPDGDAAMAAMRQVAPDLLVVDLSMPKVNGLALMRQLRYARAHAKIIVLSRYRETGYVREAFAAGARAYVLKQSPFDELRRAIDAVLRGEHHLDGAFTQPLGVTESPGGDTPLLTEREMDVLRRAALGHSNKEIGDALDIAVKTVEAHKGHAMKKLGLVNRRHLIKYAALQGWFDEA